MADETTTGTAASLVPSEIFARGIRLYPRIRPASVAVAWQEQGQGVVPIDFQRLTTSLVIAAGPKTEGSSFTRYSQGTGATSVTPAFVGSELALTDELMMSLNNGEIFRSATLRDRVRALTARIATDLMATITGSSNTAGDTSTPCTRDALMGYITEYWALNLEAEMHAILLANAAAGQLGVDTVSTTAVTAEMRNQFGTNILIGEFQGFTVLRAMEAPAEGIGFSSCITPVGDVASGLLMGVSEGITLRPPNRGSEGERDAEEYQVIRAMYGVADDDGFYLEVQSAA